MMRVTDFFKRHLVAVSRFILSLIASAMALAYAFSMRALSQEVQPLYGVPYEPVVKYGVPPFTPTPMPGPTDIVQSLPPRGVLMAIAAVAVIVVFAGAGLLYYFSHRKK